MDNAVIDSDVKSVVLNVVGRERPDSTEEDDLNWLTTRIFVGDEGEKRMYIVSLRTHSLQLLSENLTQLLKSKVQSVGFTSLEEDFRFAITRQGSQEYEVRGEVRSGGHSEAFSLTTTLEKIETFSESIRRISKKYPVLGELHRSG